MLKKYSVINLDPPWEYPKRNIGGVFGHGAIGHYPLMKIKDIVETFNMLNLIAAPNCAIFVWAVNPKMKEFMQCVTAMEKHKFRYATKAFTWIKLNKDGTPFKGIGNYTGSNEEPVFLLVRGSMKPSEKLVHSVIYHEKMKHSQKPEEMQNRVERMFPLQGNNSIELFARRQRAGWRCIGGELTGRDIREDIQLLAQEEEVAA